MSSLGVMVGVPIVCLVVVVVVVVVVLLYLRWRRQKQTADSYRDERTSRRSNHGSSTMRSDESDHPYENPSLPRKAITNKHRNNNDRSGHQDQGNRINHALPVDPYASLEGQSLPHHYEGLGEKKPSRGNSRTGASTMPTGSTAAFGEDSAYDELMTSASDQGTAGSGSGYYFRLEPGSRGGTTKSDSSGLDRSLRSNPDSPYDRIVIEDDKSNTGRPKDSAKSGTLGSSASSVSPYYFKVERNPSKNGPPTPQGLFDSDTDPKDDTDAGNVRDGSQISATRIRHSQDNLSHASSDFIIVSLPDMQNGTVAEEGGVSLQHASSYDRLDREMLRQPPVDDHANTNYSKLVPRLARETTNNAAEAQSPTIISGYQSVQISNDVEISTTADSIDGEETEYNKLERGRERDIRVLLDTTDEENSTPFRTPHEHDSPDENVPVEL